MKNFNIQTRRGGKLIALALIIGTVFTSCQDDDMTTPEPAPMTDFSGTYTTADQMGRPAINTVFLDGARKDAFNTTVELSGMSNSLE